jgi:hypothetical protein
LFTAVLRLKNSGEVNVPGFIRRKHISIMMRRRWRGVGRPSCAIFIIADGTGYFESGDILPSVPQSVSGL